MKSVFDSQFQHQFLAGNSGEKTVLALHGTGGTERDLVGLAQKLFPGASVLAPRGNISERGAARFFARHAEGVFDLESLHHETAKLASFVEDAAQNYGFDAANVWALGFSNGANIAASLLLSHPHVLKGAVLLRAMTPFSPERVPDLRGKSVFLASGQYDPIVEISDVAGLADLLRNGGADVKHEIVAADHGLVGHEIETIAEWVKAV